MLSESAIRGKRMLRAVLRTGPSFRIIEETRLSSRGFVVATDAAKQGMPSGQWPPAEKRRIVELMLRAGALKAVLPADR